MEHRHPRGRDGRGQHGRTSRRAGRAQARSVVAPMGERVALAGIGPVTPVGTGVEDFWTITSGRNGIRRITAFDIDDLPSRSRARFSFRPLAVARTPRRSGEPTTSSTTASRRPRSRGTTREARSPVRTLGGDLRDMHQGHPDPARPHSGSSRGPAASPRSWFRPAGNAASGRIVMRFGLPDRTCTVSACSSSNHAIGEAMRYIRDGYLDLCVAGGSEAATCNYDRRLRADDGASTRAPIRSASRPVRSGAGRVRALRGRAR